MIFRTDGVARLRGVERSGQHMDLLIEFESMLGDESDKHTF